MTVPRFSINVSHATASALPVPDLHNHNALLVNLDLLMTADSVSKLAQ